MLAGLGGRGFTLAPLLAEHVAALVVGAPSPLPRGLRGDRGAGALYGPQEPRRPTLRFATLRTPAGDRRMKSPLKPLAAQVVVLTGATSGIGLATARKLSAEGAALVLVARNEAALRALADELKAKGRRAEFVVADVGDEGQLRHAAQKADAAFGGFDTWINDAGISIFGTIEDTPLEDQRKLFDTNYWGVVHGSKIAAEHLKARKGGGAIINVGSVLGDFPIPIQGVYSASKHAVKGFTNALRMELMKRCAGAADHPDQAERHRHALQGARAQLHRRAGHQPAAGLRDAAGRRGDRLRLHPSHA